VRYTIVNIEAYREKAQQEAERKPCTERNFLFDRVDFGALIVAIDILRKLATGFLGLFFGVIIARVLLALLPTILRRRIEAKGALKVEMLTSKATNVSIQEHGVLSDKDNVDTKVTMGLKSGDMLRNRSTRGARTKKALGLVDNNNRTRGAVHPTSGLIKSNNTGKTIKVQTGKTGNKDLNRNRDTINDPRGRSRTNRRTNNIIVKSEKRLPSAGETSTNDNHEEALTGKIR
jgi:hypothetical protein